MSLTSFQNLPSDFQVLEEIVSRNQFQRNTYNSFTEHCASEVNPSNFIFEMNSDSRSQLADKFPPCFKPKPSKNFARRANSNALVVTHSIPTIESITRRRSANVTRKENKKLIKLANFRHLTLKSLVTGGVGIGGGLGGGLGEGLGRVTTENTTANNCVAKKIYVPKVYKYIEKFYLVKRFINLMRNATIFRRAKFLRNEHFKILNDKICFKEGWNKIMIDKHLDKDKDCFEIYWNRLKFLMKKYKTFKEEDLVFHPTKFFRMFWDFLHLIMIIAFFIIIPIEISFNLDIMAHQSLGLQGFVYFFFLLDFLVNINTAYYSKGKLIFSHRRIISRYIRHDFLKDFLSIFYLLDNAWTLPLPIRDNISGENTIYISMFFFLRVRNLNGIVKRIEEFFFVEETEYYILYLFKLIVGLFSLAHFFACLWHHIGYTSLNEQSNWLRQLGLIESEWYVRYIYSFYYVVVVINTVGFGDIVPQNNKERIFSIFFIYVACGIFAYTLNTIGLIVHNLNRKHHEFNNTILLINSYMKQQNINLDLRIRIRRYIEYIWKEEKVQNIAQTKEIISKLSKSLQEELLLNANGLLLRDLPLFSMNFSEGSLRKLVFSIQEVNLTPGDIVYLDNDLEEDQSIYMVKKGEIELFVETDPVTIISKLHKGEIFGELSFFSEEARECGARSNTFTSLYVIRKEFFLSIIKANSDDYEKFCHIRDNLKLYRNYEDFYFKCKACKEEGHSTISCPSLKLNLSKERVLSRFNYATPQQREDSQRRKKKEKLGPLKDIRVIQENVMRIREEYFFEDFDDELSHDNTTDSQDQFENDLDENVVKDNVVDTTNSKNSSCNKNFDRINTISFPHKISYEHLIPPLSQNNLFETESERSKFKKGYTSFIRQTSKDGTAKSSTSRRKNEKNSLENLFKERMISMKETQSSHTANKNDVRNEKLEIPEKNKIGEFVSTSKPVFGLKSFTRSVHEKTERIITKTNNCGTSAIDKLDSYESNRPSFERTNWDISKTFIKYFPHNNIGSVIARIQQEETKPANGEVQPQSSFTKMILQKAKNNHKKNFFKRENKRMSLNKKQVIKLLKERDKLNNRKQSFFAKISKGMKKLLTRTKTMWTTRNGMNIIIN